MTDKTYLSLPFVISYGCCCLLLVYMILSMLWHLDWVKFNEFNASKKNALNQKIDALQIVQYLPT